VLDELADAPLVLELVRLAGALVGDGDAHPGVEERELAQPLAEDLEVVLPLAENDRVRLEADRGAAKLSIPDDLQLGLGHPALVVLDVGLAVPEDLQVQILAERIDAGNPHAVQAGGDRVGVVVELAPGVQHREDHLGRGPTFGRVHLGGNAAPVVDHADRVVGVDDHVDVRAVAGQRLVDGVVHDLPHQLMQAGVIGRADVHARTLADRLEALEHGDARSVILLVLCRWRGLVLFCRIQGSLLERVNRRPLPRLSALPRQPRSGFARPRTVSRTPRKPQGLYNHSSL